MGNSSTVEAGSRRKPARPRGRVEDLGNGRWRVRVSLGRNAAGKRLYATQTVRGTATQAKAALTTVLRRRDQGVQPSLTRESVDEWIRLWLSDHCSDISARTRRDYEAVLARYLPAEVLGRRLTDLSVDDLQRVVKAMQDRGLSPTTVHSFRAAIRASLSDAQRLGKVVRNIAKALTLPKKEHHEMRSLTVEETQRLLRGVADSPYNALFVIWVNTGLRNAELAALSWSDFDGSTLHVRRAFVYGGPGRTQVLGPPKTGRARSIPLSADAIAALKVHRKDQVQHVLRYRDVYNDRGLIFATTFGNPLQFQNIQRRFWKPLLKRLGLPDIRMYDLRHTCASLLLAHGENVKVVSDRLGHSKIQLTLDTYCHVLPGQQLQASERLQDLLRTG